MSTLIESELRIHNMERFKDKLESLNKKAIKLGFQPITFDAGDLVTYTEKDEFGDEIVYQYYPVMIHHEEQIKLPGDWKLVAVLDHKEGLHRVVPGMTMPEHFRDRGPVCDHCGLDRNRNETFVLYEPSGFVHYIQVGRQCLGQFLGINPDLALMQIDWFKSAQEEDFGSGEREMVGYKLDNYLSHVALMIRIGGWVSRGKAYDDRREVATADAAWFNLTDKRTIHYIKPTESDRAVGERTAAWMAILHQERTDMNDFMYNLATIGKNGFVTFKSAGYAAAGINAMNKEIEEARSNANKRHLGTVGKKYTTDVTLVKSSSNDYGHGVSYRHRFIDHEGNVIIWSTQTELEIGMDYEITGKVKEHLVNKYNGEIQTIMTHCKVI